MVLSLQGCPLLNYSVLNSFLPSSAGKAALFQCDFFLCCSHSIGEYTQEKAMNMNSYTLLLLLFKNKLSSDLFFFGYFLLNSFFYSIYFFPNVTIFIPKVLAWPFYSVTVTIKNESLLIYFSLNINWAAMLCSELL